MAQGGAFVRLNLGPRFGGSGGFASLNLGVDWDENPVEPVLRGLSLAAAITWRGGCTGHALDQCRLGSVHVPSVLAARAMGRRVARRWFYISGLGCCPTHSRPSRSAMGKCRSYGRGHPAHVERVAAGVPMPSSVMARLAQRCGDLLSHRVDARLACPWG